jgi:hypothetical protein
MAQDIQIVPGRQGRPKERKDHPVGYELLTVADSAVGFATIPLNANKAVIVVEDATIRWRIDGTNPDANTGTKSFVNSTIILDSRDQIDNFKAIRQGTTSAKLSVNYYERK